MSLLDLFHIVFRYRPLQLSLLQHVDMYFIVDPNYYYPAVTHAFQSFLIMYSCDGEVYLLPLRSCNFTFDITVDTPV